VGEGAAVSDVGAGTDSGTASVYDGTAAAGCRPGGTHRWRVGVL